MANPRRRRLLCLILGLARPSVPSIAILPFKNLSGDPDQDFLAEGLRLGILSSLVQLSGLFLIGTGAVNGFRDQNVPAAQAGAKVGARYVLGGAVQQVGKHLRATLQLTDVVAGKIVWSERYDRDVDDLFKVQDEITQEVLLSLDVELRWRREYQDFFCRRHQARSSRALPSRDEPFLHGDQRRQCSGTSSLS